VPTPLESAAAWAAEQHIATLPESAVHHGKRVILDWFAAALAGGDMVPARALAAALPGDGPAWTPAAKRAICARRR
jgi:hypothetical protein